MKPRDELGSRVSPDCSEGGGSSIPDLNRTGAFFPFGECAYGLRIKLKRHEEFM